MLISVKVIFLAILELLVIFRRLLIVSPPVYFFCQLKFEDDLRISNMYSAEGEMVQFSEKLYPTGNVEDWLLEVENTMRSSLREILYQALQEYGDVSIVFSLRFSSDELFPALFFSENFSRFVVYCDV